MAGHRSDESVQERARRLRGQRLAAAPPSPADDPTAGSPPEAARTGEFPVPGSPPAAAPQPAPGPPQAEASPPPPSESYLRLEDDSRNLAEIQRRLDQSPRWGSAVRPARMRMRRQLAGLVAVVALAVVAAGSFLAPPSEPESLAFAEPTLASDDEAGGGTPLTDDEIVERLIRHRLESSNRNVDRVSSVTFDDDDRLLVTWTVNGSLTETPIKLEAWLDVLEILLAVDEAGVSHNGVDVTGTFEIQEESGERSEIDVIRASYDRSLLEAVDVASFDGGDILTLADSTFIHPSFSTD